MRHRMESKFDSRDAVFASAIAARRCRPRFRSRASSWRATAPERRSGCRRSSSHRPATPRPWPIRPPPAAVGAARGGRARGRFRAPAPRPVRRPFFASSTSSSVMTTMPDGSAKALATDRTAVRATPAGTRVHRPATRSSRQIVACNSRLSSPRQLRRLESGAIQNCRVCPSRWRDPSPAGMTSAAQFAIAGTPQVRNAKESTPRPPMSPAPPASDFPANAPAPGARPCPRASQRLVDRVVLVRFEHPAARKCRCGA